MPDTDTAPPLAEDHPLTLVVKGTQSVTGIAFYQVLVRNLATALDTTAAWVTEVHPESGRVRTLAAWMHGRFQDPGDSALPGTPCAWVLRSKACLHVPDGVLARFPTAAELQRVQAVSYLGLPLLEPSGRLLGHLAVLDTKPLPHHPRLLPLFEIFAARATAEHRRLIAEREIRHRDERLRQLTEEMARLRARGAHNESPCADPHEPVEGPLPAAPTGTTSTPSTPGPAEWPILTATEFTAFEKANLERALHAAAWKIAGRNGAAARLGVPPSTLSSRMKALGIQRLPPVSPPPQG